MLCALFAFSAAATSLNLDTLLPADALLLGEQHDVAAHQRQHREIIEALAARSMLAAVALEMAEKGVSTVGLPADSTEASVRASLRWDDAAWPWSAYGPPVMAAVRAGVVVLGANLPRGQVRAAMAEAPLDSVLANTEWGVQMQAIRDGHCGLLPESQIGPMTRVQIARDRAMAQAVTGALVPGKTVLLLAGGGHVDPALGVPRHLPPQLRISAFSLPRQATGRDYCAEMRQSLPKAR